MDDSINWVASHGASIMKAIGRKLSGSSFESNIFTGTTAKKAAIAFGNALPGDITAMAVHVGQTLYLEGGSYLCGTPNVQITSSSNVMRGIFTGTNAFYVSASIANTSGAVDGMIWVSAYGGVKKLDIADGQKMIIDPGIFLCADKKFTFQLTRPGHAFTTMAKSGEGLMMEYHGPATVYVQSGNKKYFNQLLAERTASSDAARAARLPPMHQILSPFGDNSSPMDESGPVVAEEGGEEGGAVGPDEEMI